jgi:hypothetical protein
MVWLLDEGFDYQSAAGVIDEVAVWRPDAATAAGMEIGALAGLGNKISRDSPETPSATSAGSRVAGPRCHESHDDRFVISLCLCDADHVPGPLIGRAFAVGELESCSRARPLHRSARSISCEKK